jgi:hypothetical protein
VGTAIALHQYTGLFNSPKTIEELTTRTAAVEDTFASGHVSLGDHDKLPEDLESLLCRNQQAVSAMGRDLRAAVARDRDMELVLHYGGDPVLHPGVARSMTVDCLRRGTPAAEAQIRVTAPEGWRLQTQTRDHRAFTITPAPFGSDAQLLMQAKTGGESYAASFTVLGSELAPGFPSAQNVERCPDCQGRQGACLCVKRGG